MLFTRLMLPIDRNGSPGCCLSALTNLVRDGTLQQSGVLPGKRLFKCA